MSAFRTHAREFIDTLRLDNAESQKQIDQLERTGTLEKPYGAGSLSDGADREIARLKQDILSRERTIARLEEELAT